jgi:hypothetical protein
MSTPAQIAANRKNAELSSGPKSLTGKDSSSMNNFKFGLTGGRFMLLEWEEEEEWDKLLADLRQEYQPSTPTEKILVDDMAKSHWLTLRARALQHFCFDPNNPVTGAEAYKAKLALYIRYETTHSRAFHKCLKELLSLRQQRRKEEIGFESQNLKKQAQQAVEFRRAKQEARQDALHQVKNEPAHRQKHPPATQKSPTQVLHRWLRLTKSSGSGPSRIISVFDFSSCQAGPRPPWGGRKPARVARPACLWLCFGSQPRTSSTLPQLLTYNK